MCIIKFVQGLATDPSEEVTDALLKTLAKNNSK